MIQLTRKNQLILGGSVLALILIGTAIKFRHLLDSEAEQITKGVNTLMAERYQIDPRNKDAWVDDAQKPHFAISICEKQTVSIGQEKHVLLAICGQDYNGDQAAAGRIDLFTLKLQDGQLKTTAKMTELSSGTLSSPSTIKAVKLGKAFHGFMLDEAAGEKDVSASKRTLIVPGKKGLVKAATFLTQIDSSSSAQCSESEDKCATLSFAMSVDNSKPDVKVYPVNVNMDGTIGTEKVSSQFKLDFNSKTWRYNIPKDFPKIN